MAVLNFPAGPSVNEQYTSNGITYRFDGSKWKVLSAEFLDTSNDPFAILNDGGDLGAVNDENITNIIDSGSTTGTVDNDYDLGQISIDVINGIVKPGSFVLPPHESAFLPTNEKGRLIYLTDTDRIAVSNGTSWTEISGTNDYNELINTPILSTVATSGNYTDLINTPDLTQYATQNYVSTEISNLVNSAPDTLDTLNELAQALGSDPNFATTVTNELSLKADTSSLSTVATSGDYNDLINTPDNSSGVTTGKAIAMSIVFG